MQIGSDKPVAINHKASAKALPFAVAAGKRDDGDRLADFFNELLDGFVRSEDCGVVLFVRLLRFIIRTQSARRAEKYSKTENKQSMHRDLSSERQKQFIPIVTEASPKSKGEQLTLDG